MPAERFGDWPFRRGSNVVLRTEAHESARLSSVIALAVMHFRTLATGSLLVIGLFSLSCGHSRSGYDYRAENLGDAIYRVGPGDVLKVNVWKNDQLSQEVSVRPDGAITLPLLGDVQVAGKSLEQIDAAIIGQGSRFFTEPLSVTTQVLQIKSYRIYVLGEVQKPGEYTPGTQVTVLQALSLGGGLTRFASSDEIVVIRHDEKGPRRIPFVYSEVVRRGGLEANLVLQSGDTVVVP